MSHESVFDIFYGPSSGSSTKTTPVSDTTSPQLDIHILDTVPFAESFSGLINMDDSDDDLDYHKGSPEVTYDIEHFKNIPELMPEWEHDDIDEIMVISTRTRLRTITEENVKEALNPPQSISVSDFEFLRVLGTGNTARVTLARTRDDQRLYAVKSMRKSLIYTEGCAEHARSEQATLKMATELNASFLPKLYWSFQDDVRLYLAMEFYSGGDLLTHLTRGDAFGPERARFYASEIAQGIATLHEAGIVHRDLKPENVMIDRDGHIVLTDFGCAKMLGGPGTSLRRTVTTCGTREYQAPEMLLGWSHDFAVDCWGFGLLLYVMLYGSHPFMVCSDAQDLSALRSRIVHGPTPFKSTREIDVDGQDLIAKCLERNSAVRLSIQEIKEHGYFSSVDWISLVSKALPAPYIPALDESGVDVSYFDKEVTEMAIDLMLPALDSEWQSLCVQQSPDSFDGFSYARQSPGEININSASSSSTLPVAEFSRFLSRTQKSVVPPNRREARSKIVVGGEQQGNPEEAAASDVVDPIYDPNDFKPLAADTLKDHQAFWDSLSDDSSPSNAVENVFTWPSHPRKLRKKRVSFEPYRMSAASSSLGRPRAQNKLRKKTSGIFTMATPAPPEDVSLPTGVKQIGDGIGYRHRTLAVLPRSRFSISGKTPRQFLHRLSSFGAVGLGYGIQKAKRHIGFRRRVIVEPDPACDILQITSESSTALTNADLDADLATSLPEDFPPLEPSTNVACKGDAHATAGGPHTSLRLVSALGLSPTLPELKYFGNTQHCEQPLA
ncbi:hypothetical protein PLICRDRAFT_50385 [Plicaturopsis crispa FD-325 SS-3]|nr:hypothetical protein PLICRDRAFT_50385 [Plicaturopsis crispa FD-325 SS-3]